MAFDAALKDCDLSFHAHRPTKDKRLARRMRRITKKTGSSKILIHSDAKPRANVLEVIGERSLCVVANRFTKWGSHLAIRALVQHLRKPYVLSKVPSPDITGWVILGVDAKGGRSPRKTEKLYRKAGRWQQ